MNNLPISYVTKYKNIDEIFKKLNPSQLLNVVDWDINRKSSLIESLILDLPISDIYLQGNFDNWTILDGTKRLQTIHDFVNNKFCLNNLTFFNSLNELFYKDLIKGFQRKIEEHQCTIHLFSTYTQTDFINYVLKTIK